MTHKGAKIQEVRGDKKVLIEVAMQNGVNAYFSTILDAIKFINRQRLTT
jgi:hypothetical protein